MTELIELPEQRVLYVREKVPVSELPAFQGRAFQAIWADLDSAHVPVPAHPYVRYHLVTAEEMDVEAGVPVAAEQAAGETVRAGTLPGGPALTHRHLGSHERLAEAYAALESGDTDGLVPNGAPWEVYEWIAGADVLTPEAWPRPDEWRTLLVQPLAARATG